ncbi:MAG: phage baseplate assembly protein V [Anaerolineales bacterium]|nr:phage baseplate assembly protein V [Anaerolineales bacterium]
MNNVQAFPQIVITINGKLLTVQDMQGLAEIRVRQGLSVPAQCELLFRAPPGPLTEAEKVKIGAKVQVDVQGTLFIGEVTAVEHVYTAQNVHEIYVRSYDALYRMRKNQSVRIFKNARLSDLARKFAAQANVNLAKSNTRGVNTQWPLVYQHQQSDLELLNDLAGQVGLYAVIKGAELNLVSLDGRGDPIQLTLGGNLNTARIETNADALVNRVEVRSWNPQNAEYSQIDSARLNGITVSSRISQQIATSKRTLINKPSAHSGAGKIAAEAELMQRAATGVRFWGITDGHSGLQPGVIIDVVGVAREVEGLYVLTEAVHTINAQSGYETELFTMPPTAPKKSSSDVITLGKVIDVRDSDNLGRLKASLPTYGDVETDWMQMLSPGAGAGKGFVAPPEKGDMVLILLVHGNPAFGLVIGGLYSEKSKPPETRGLGNKIAGNAWITAGGQRVELDDGKNVIRLENNEGAYIEIAGDKITIAGGAIDFKRV